MEKLVIARVALAGGIAGLLAYVYARILAEPIIGRAIALEEERAAAEQSAHAGHAGMEEEAEVFSRAVQENVGLGAGIVVFGIAVGALFAVAYCIAAPKFPQWSPRSLSLAVAGSLFVGFYVIAYLKYPPVPPAVGDPDTIEERTAVYLLLVAIGLALVAAAWVIGLSLVPKTGGWAAALIGGAIVVVGSVIAFLILPDQLSAGDYPADDLYWFRTHSFIAQLVLWGGIGLIGGELVHRLTLSKGTATAVTAAA